MNDMVILKIRRQDDPDDLSYWETFEVPFSPGMTVAMALREVQKNSITKAGGNTTPVVCDISCMEGSCGSCTMIINGKVANACTTLVSAVGRTITLKPLTKFPIVRDLKVDRSQMFDLLQKFECFAETDELFGLDVFDLGSNCDSQKAEKYSGCTMCGACVEVCPQVNARSPFVGAFIFAKLFVLNLVQSFYSGNEKRLNGILQSGGVADCAGASVCALVCPSNIDLPSAISQLSGKAGIHSLKSFFLG